SPAPDPGAQAGRSHLFTDLSGVLKYANLAGAFQKPDFYTMMKHLRDSARSAPVVPRRTVRRVVRVLKCFEDSASLYLTPNLPAEGLQNARTSCAVPPTEQVLGLIDFTGDEDDMRYGCLFGAAGFYYRVKTEGQDAAGAIPYAEFPRRAFVNHGKAVY